MKTLYTTLSIALVLVLGGCFKNEPKKETYKAAGSWLVEKCFIQNMDSTGALLTEETITDGGILMLNHDDDFQFQNGYSYQLDADKLKPSRIYKHFSVCNTWGLGATAKAMNLGYQDPESGYVSRYVSYTMLKLKDNKMQFQFIQINEYDNITYLETWQLKKGTH